MKNSKSLNYIFALFLVICMSMLLSNKNVYANENNNAKKGLKDIVGHELKEKVNDQEILHEEYYAGGYNWGKFGARYYYNKLTSSEKGLYDKIYNRCTVLLNSSNINCDDMIESDHTIGKMTYDKNMSSEDLDRVFWAFESENPQFFFLSTSYWSGTTKENQKFCSLVVYPQFVNGNNRINIANEFKNRLENFLKTAMEKKTEMQRLRRFEILLVNSTKYKQNDLDQSAVSLVLYGQTVCAGYAKTYTMLCNAIGNEAVCVTGSHHEWSRVRIGSKWYNVDATWDDDDVSGVTGMRYFLVSDEKTKVGNNGHELDPRWKGRVCAPASNEDFLNPIFNVTYYKNHYSDLRKAFGEVEALYLDHFMQSGVEEGRRASEYFDVIFYKNNNSDLKKVYGDDLAQYYQHYAEYGINEYRNGAKQEEICDEKYKTTYDGVDYSPVYNYEYYISHNPDVKKVYGTNVKVVLKHFVENGMKEGRQGKDTFDVNAYRRANLDLRIAYGKDLKKYYIHYIEYGIHEKNRVTKNCDTIVNPLHTYDGVDYSLVYNYEYYISHNPDVKKVFGEDDIAVLKHFVENGMREGRQGNISFNVNSYKQANLDLIKVFGDNNKNYYIHYIEYGYKEGRRIA